MKTYGVIMAGGGGTRFWPLSRKETPKQLLNLSGNNVMVNEAIERLSRVATYKDIFIVTNAVQKALTGESRKTMFSWNQPHGTRRPVSDMPRSKS